MTDSTTNRFGSALQTRPGVLAYRVSQALLSTVSSSGRLTPATGDRTGYGQRSHGESHECGATAGPPDVPEQHRHQRGAVPPVARPA
ncbi:hypothetical protein Nm8I071_43660 [Nonomuraea sp. TT08I-71]|nr:hypothetical protein Nm8I071_43660 [Nonomuraea sp. TT08I-71]